MFAKIPILGKLESNFVSIRVLENEGKNKKKVRPAGFEPAT